MNLLKEGFTNHFVQESGRTTKLTIDGITSNYPIYLIRLDLLYYNDRNDRIATWISQYKAHNNIVNLDKTDKEAYNSVIHDFISKSNPEKLKTTQKNIECIGQQQYGIVLNDGRIIDGNRRFTCLRNLAEQDSKFNYFEAVIIDQDYENNEKQIKMLELQIQIGEDVKVDYDPIDRLVGIYNDIVANRLLTVNEYARSTNRSDKDVEKMVELANLMVDFLETINAPGQYYLARELDINGPLHELQALLKKVPDDAEKERIKCIVFTNMLIRPNSKNEKHMDLTRFVRNFKKINNSKYADDFLDKEEKVCESILDSLPKAGKVTEATLSEFGSNEHYNKALHEVMDITMSKVNIADTKNHSEEILKKVNDLMGDVDQHLFPKLSEDQRENISGLLDSIETKIEEIRGSLDV